MKLERLKEVALLQGCEVRVDEPLSMHTTFKIGGPADLLIIVQSVEALAAVIKEAKVLDIPVMVIGKGSNLLVKDGGIRGAVIKLGLFFSEMKDLTGGKLEVGAGVSLAAICVFAKKQKLTGIEFAWGIPGCMGGATFMNAGAYGAEMSHVITAVTHMTYDGKIHTVLASDLEFGYRHSVYQTSNAIILSVTLSLANGDPKLIQAKMDEFITRRKSKQPLEYPSAGSVFKRPEGYFAGTLIEECGLKEKCVGGAMVSKKHAGFIINIGGATCADVLGLIYEIQEVVFEQTGVSLSCEVRAIGED